MIGLPETIFDRIPFPGPALAARVIGEVNPERIDTVRSHIQYRDQTSIHD